MWLCLDVGLQRGLLEVRWSAVVDKVEHGIELALAPANAFHFVSDGLKLGQVLLQELLGLVGGDLVALLHALCVSVAYGPHTCGVLIGREHAALELLDGIY